MTEQQRTIKIVVTEKEKKNFQELCKILKFSESNLFKFFVVNNFIQWNTSDIPVTKEWYIEELKGDIFRIRKYPIYQIQSKNHPLFSLIPFFEWGELIKLNGEKK